MAITKMAILVALVVGLLAMVQQSVQMSDHNSCMLRETGDDLSRSAIVFSEKASERAILQSGDFVHTGTEVITGKVFQTGTLMDRSVVLVDTGKYSANVSSALQIALSCYRIKKVLYLGLAGDLTGGNKMKIGDAIIPQCLTFTAIWDWLSLSANPQGHLVFGKFNQGGSLQNSLASVKFNDVTLCIDEQWMKLATVIQNLLPQIKIHIRSAVASSDMTIYNGAYAKFLNDKFGFAAADQGSATVALVSELNGKLYYVFQGVSHIAASGVAPSPEEEKMAATNAYLTLKTALTLLEEPETRRYINTYV